MLKLHNKTNFDLHSFGPGSAKNAGFTMMELMVVVVIVGIVATIAIPNYNRMARTMDFQTQYNGVRGSVQKCRATALSRSDPVASPTTLVLFTNGYACISWADLGAPADSKLGNGPVVMGANGVLDAGEANGEVLQVYFQERFDQSIALNATARADGSMPLTRIDVVDSLLQNAGLDQDEETGFAFIYAPGGYLLTADRSMLVASVVMRPKEGTLSQFTLYPSGQMVGR